MSERKEERRARAEAMKVALNEDCKAEIRRFNEAQEETARQSERLKVILDKANSLKEEIISLEDRRVKAQVGIDRLTYQLEGLKGMVESHNLMIEEQKKTLDSKLDETDKLCKIKIDYADEREALSNKLRAEADILIGSAKRIMEDAKKDHEKAQSKLLEADKREREANSLSSKAKPKLDAIEAQIKALQGQKTEIEGLLQEKSQKEAKLTQKEAFLTNKEIVLKEKENDLSDREMNLNIRENDIVKLETKVKYLIETSKVKI